MNPRDATIHEPPNIEPPIDQDDCQHKWRNNQCIWCGLRGEPELDYDEARAKFGKYYKFNN